MGTLQKTLTIGFLTLILAGCRESKVSSYRVPKEQDPALPAAGADSSAPSGQAAGGSMADASVPVDTGPSLTWKAPADWTAKPASAMRKGSYAVPGAGGEAGDLSITAFPGAVGGLIANVNRWRGQVQLPPLTEADLPSAVTAFAENGLEVTLVDFPSPGGGKRILGAIIPLGDSSWFFKLTGTNALITAAKPGFLNFLKTIKPSAQAAAAAPSPAAPAAGGASMADTPVQTSSGAGLAWTAPTGWTAKPASAMRKGSYAVPGAGGDSGDLSITAFPGDVGGLLANVNRWRGQVQLPPLGEADLAGSVTSLPQGGLTLTLVDAASTDGAKRILGAIVPLGDSTWFFKLTGSDALVGSSKPAFVAFLRTVRPAGP